MEEWILKKNSHLCVGLDIAVEAFPGADPNLDFLKAHAKKVINATRELAVAYKPNFGFFERWGSKGFEWLEETLDYIGNEHILVADAKRGDIGNDPWRLSTLDSARVPPVLVATLDICWIAVVVPSFIYPTPLFLLRGRRRWDHHHRQHPGQAPL